MPPKRTGRAIGAITAAVAACVTVPPSPPVRSWGEGPAAWSACELVVVSWNVQKRAGPRFEAEVADHARDADLVVVQESTEPGSVRALPPFVTQVVTFRRRRDGRATGVATAATVVPRDSSPHWSPDREPISRTPKSALVSTFAMPTQTLLVINVHAINFRSAAALRRQLQPLGVRIAAHDGPVLLAGDLNTWSRGRRQVVQNFAQAHGLDVVDFGVDTPRLDWMLTRGLTTRAASVHRSRVSDHDALRARLRSTDCDSSSGP